MDFDAIITGIRKAIYGREVREYIASSMEWTRDFVNQSIANIKELLRQAEAARDAAKASQDAAKVSETNAKASENAAKASENAAASSASAAAGSASAAKTSETNAKASENESRQLVEAAKKVVNTDKTLTIDGAPADAKTVGDKFKSIKTDWNSVTDKPETFPPSAHNHSAANITSGILGLARGGTGCSTAMDACETLLWRGELSGAPNWDALDTGIWRTTPEHWGTNGPSGVYTYGIAMVWNYAGNVTQVYIAYSTGEMAFRQRWTDVNGFSGWARVNTGGTLSPYPVGAIYISTSSTSPASLFGGTWESIASERVLMGVSSSHGAGSTVSAGLPNIKGSVLDTWHGSGPSGSGALRVAVNGRGSIRTGNDGTFTWGNFYFDAASYNSIYGNASTVQPAAYYVYMWRRTA
jgi:hypothetical protein